jgi:hypothetical protein
VLRLYRGNIYVFCIYLRTNSDLCHLQHKLIGFITEMKSVCSAVRTGSLNTAVCASSLKGSYTIPYMYLTTEVNILSHTKLQYSYSKEMFSGRAKSIRIIGGPDNQRPDKRSYTIFINTLRMGDADLRFYITTVQDG